MLKPVVLFIIGLICLIKGGDWFVDGATGLARRFHLPEIIVGATVVSIGTTLPEVMVSTTGALNGQGAMAYGNAIGSIICNTALIAAISLAVKPGPVDTKSMKMPVLFFFGAAAIYCVAAYVFGYFYWWLGLILLSIFAVYMVLTVRQGLKNPDAAHDEEEIESKPRKLWQELLLLVVGAALIAVGADLLVDHGTIIATELGVPETVIALTFVALGTSLPELVTTITSLKKGHGSLGLGNVIGANIFNLVLVSGVSVTLAPFEVPVGNMLFGINSSLVLDIPLMLVVMLLLTVPALLTKKVHRWQGITLLSIYAAFCVLQFVM
jgi:cation:H+ antiporter